PCPARHPPCTLFPSTTLFRSQVREHVIQGHVLEGLPNEGEAVGMEAAGRQAVQDVSGPNLLALNARLEVADHEPDQIVVAECIRSEEHTSELQSLTNLACRLL